MDVFHPRTLNNKTLNSEIETQQLSDPFREDFG